MKRNLFLFFLCFLWLACLSCFAAKPQLDGTSRSPNIVILFADDMGFSDIGCYGSEIETPNLDQLAQGGLRFSHFYNAGRCCPSRASILTGLYQHQAGIGHMAGDKGLVGYRDFLSFNAVTIPEVLKGAGYRTMMSGKWHVGWRDEGSPTARGFDRFYGTRGYIDSYYTTVKRTEMYLDDKMVIPVTKNPVNHLHPEQEWYTTDVFTDYALHFMDEAVEMKKPFFLYLAYNAPHFPLHAKPEDLKKYRGRYKDKGWNRLRKERYARLVEMGILQEEWALSPQDSPEWDSLNDAEKDELDFKMALYAAIVDRLDQNIGRVVEKLRETGQLDNTLILFLSDNGGTKETGMFGIKGHAAGVANYDKWAKVGGWTSSYGQGWANLSNVPFRLYKRFNHEGGISTPLIAHWPNGIEARGGVTHQVGHIVDVMATCVDVAGAEYPTERNGKAIQSMEGKSLAPVFGGNALGARTLFWEHEGHRAIRDGRWKLVGEHQQPWELYDMSRDRSELRNIAAANPEAAKKLKRTWDEWAKRANVLPWEDVKARKKPPKETAGLKPIEIRVDPKNLATLARPSFSVKRGGRDRDESIQDGKLPQGSGDKQTLHRSWWPRKGSEVWAQYDFEKPQEVSGVEVYWFHDHPNGGCKVPASWRVTYLRNGEWKPVSTEDPFRVEVDRLNQVGFKSVTTLGLRIEAQLQERVSGGIHEWRVHR